MRCRRSAPEHGHQVLGLGDALQLSLAGSAEADLSEALSELAHQARNQDLAGRGLRGDARRQDHRGYGVRSERGTRTAALFYSLIESAKLCGVEPRAYLRQATLRAVRDPGAVTLARELKWSESQEKCGG